MNCLIAGAQAQNGAGQRGFYEFAMVHWKKLLLVF